jgi:cytochrome P450
MVACLEWTLAHLMDQPDVQDKLRREIDGKMINAGSFELQGHLIKVP